MGPATGRVESSSASAMALLYRQAKMEAGKQVGIVPEALMSRAFSISSTVTCLWLLYLQHPRELLKVSASRAGSVFYVWTLPIAPTPNK